jgi:rhomboid protease GluP
VNLGVLVQRICALGYEEVSVAEAGYKVFLRKEPFLRKVLVVNDNSDSFPQWKEFLKRSVLPLQGEDSAFTVALLLPSGEKVSSFLAEFNWIETIWSISGYGVKTIKKASGAEQHWMIEERLIASTQYPVPEQKEEVMIYRGSFLPYLLLAVNLLLFILTIMSGDSQDVETLIRMGAKYNPLIWLGEWWRLLTSLFLHAGFLHFFMNSYALYQLGVVVERLFGQARFFFIYFFSGISGSAASTLFRPEAISVGASGAIFGLFGALVYFGIRKPVVSRRFFGRSLWMTIGINLLLGFTIPGIDYVAHLGGLFGGLLCAAAVGLGQKDYLQRRWFWRGACLLSLLVLVWLALTPPAVNWYQPLEAGRIALQQGDIGQALSSLEKSYRLNPEGSLTKNYLLEAYIYRLERLYEENDLAEIIKTYQRMIQIEDYWVYHFNLGRAYLNQQKYANAKREFTEVLRLKPGNKEARRILEVLEEYGY